MLLHSSSPLSLSCSTPSRASFYSARSHQPMSSSPLASPGYSSPTHEAQERRRAQYKSTISSSSKPAVAKLLFRGGAQASQDSQKTFLRDRFQARYREHAQKLRDWALNSRRSSDKSSDVFMDCNEDEDSDDVIMQDELFRRIMQSAGNKINHSYRVSYALEVGSSFDPDMEDAGVWESELRDFEHKRKADSVEETPDDLEAEELLEYAEQCAALADFADLDLDYDDNLDDMSHDMPAWRSQSHRTWQVSEMDMT